MCESACECECVCVPRLYRKNVFILFCIDSLQGWTAFPAQHSPGWSVHLTCGTVMIELYYLDYTKHTTELSYLALQSEKMLVKPKSNLYLMAPNR